MFAKDVASAQAMTSLLRSWCAPPTAFIRSRRSLQRHAVKVSYGSGQPMINAEEACGSKPRDHEEGRMRGAVAEWASTVSVSVSLSLSLSLYAGTKRDKRAFLETSKTSKRNARIVIRKDQRPSGRDEEEESDFIILNHRCISPHHRVHGRVS